MKATEINEDTTPIDLAEVYQAAANTPKLRKLEVFGLVLGLIRGDEVLDVGNLATLYSFFLPAPPARCKTPEQWVAKVVAGRDDARYYLRYVYSNGSRLMATDGHRLHYWVTDTYPKGFYDVALNPVTVDANFPDIDRVIPKRGRVDVEKTFTLADLEAVDASARTDKGSAKIACQFPGDKAAKQGFNRQYLLQALNGAKEVELLGRSTLKRSILISGPFPDCYAVLMPMKVV